MKVGERRNHPRRRVRRLMAQGKHGERQALWMVEDLSIGGAFVRSEHPVPGGTPVFLSLIRPGGQRIGLTGCVIRLAQYGQSLRRWHGLAIAFEGRAADALDELRTLLV